MSIDALLKEMIEAIRENTAALNGAPADKPSKPSGTKATGGKKGPTLAALTKLAGQMMNGETDLDEDDARAALGASKKHHGYKLSETPAESAASAMAELKAFIAGEDPYAGDEEEEKGDEELM